MDNYKTNSIISLLGLTSYIKQRVYQQKNEQLKLDLVALAKDGGNIDKDLFLYLRPLKLAGPIQFKNMFDKDSNVLISFEEGLSRALVQPSGSFDSASGEEI
jgi:hypothetical protein